MPVKSKLPWKAAPHVYKHLYENKFVRILDVHLKPGTSTPLHKHFRRLVYAIKGSHIKAVDDKGTPQEFRFKNNHWYILPAMVHAPKNVDTETAHYLSIEFKK